MEPMAERTDSEILATIAQLFVVKQGTWPYPREIAEALGGGVNGLTAQLERLMFYGRLGFHCCGGTRRVVLLVPPSEYEWRKNGVTVAKLVGWIRANGLAPKVFPEDACWWNEYYAAFLVASRETLVASA